MAEMNKVLTDMPMTLTDAKKRIARNNIGAMGAAPDDGYYVARGGEWVKMYGLTSTPIEGFPVEGDEYEKLSVFNGYLYPYVLIAVEGTATVGLFNYDTMEYDKEVQVTDGSEEVMVSVGGNYEIHAKGTGAMVSVMVSADAFDGGSGNEE